MTNKENNIILDAKGELDSIHSSTEEAAETILNSIEKIENMINETEDKDLIKKFSEEVNNIYEASNFQDLTGQRVKKVVSILEHIESIAGDIIANNEQISAKNSKSLENGPQKHKSAPSQDDIDKLFDSI